MGWTAVHGYRDTYVKLFAGNVAPADVPAQSVSEQTFSPPAFAQLRVGDSVSLSAPGPDPLGLIRANARVSAPGTVAVTWHNLRALVQTPVAGQYVLLITAVREGNEAP